MRWFTSPLCICAGLMVSAAGCTAGQLYDLSGDAGITLVDSATRRDARGDQDGAASTDAGARSDVGLPNNDAGVRNDAGARNDAGLSMDGGGVEPDSGPPPPTGVDADDMELFTLINDYRVSRGLPAIVLSPSLSEVARTHVADLMANGANSGSCNLHSWSNEGSWSGCCYTPDHAQASCMWDKPRELTVYPGNGYEISTGGARDGAHALSLWQSSPGHHDVIINAGIWTQAWGAMGIAITPGAFAHVWFGREAEPAL